MQYKQGDRVKIRCIAPKRAKPVDEPYLKKFCRLAGSSCLGRSGGFETVYYTEPGRDMVSFKGGGCCPCQAVYPSGPEQLLLFNMSKVRNGKDVQGRGQGKNPLHSPE